jgi:hypothetical protein
LTNYQVTAKAFLVAGGPSDSARINKQEVANMNHLVVSLGPVFAVGFAMQQLLELLASISTFSNNKSFEKYKKAILGVVSLIAGLAMASSVPELRILKPLGVNTPLDVAITGLVPSAGTEGVNSILKFLKYSKEDKKYAAASKDPASVGAAVGQPSETALNRINLS